MSRYHWWGFIVNEAGEPIENAEVTVKIAGTDVVANVYYDEYGNANSVDTPALSAGPQLSTLSNGYYEFWIGDVTETQGYANSEKFTLEWIRLGVAHGKIEYINIFPLGPQTYPAAIVDCVDPSIKMDKLISNYMACKWDQHVDSVVIDGDGLLTDNIHGLEFVRVDQLDEVENKIISNYHGWHWHEHRLSTVQNPAPPEGGLPNEGKPHGMAEVNPLNGSDTVRNKLVSNCDLWNLSHRIDNLKLHSDDRDDNLQYQIDNLRWTTDSSKSGWWEIFTEDWIRLNIIEDIWYVDIAHGLDINYPLVQVYEKTTNTIPGKVISTTEMQFIGTNTIRISINNNNAPNDPTDNLIVRIANGGVHRHPETP
jgi:hypothetical protein